MNRIAFHLFVVSVLIISLPRAHADAGWVLMTADFRQEPVALESITAQGVRVVRIAPDAPAGPQPTVIPFDSFLQIDRTSQPKSIGANLTLILVGGDRLAGQPVACQDEQVIWRSPAAGELKVPLKQVRALVRYGNRIENLDEPPLEDRALLSNGDLVKGIVTDLTDSKLTIQAAAPLEIPLDSIRWVHFAMTGQAPPAIDRGFRVRMNDDSLFRASSIQSDGQKVILSLPGGGSREVALVAVAGIEQLNGPVSWLSSRVPAQVIQVPYFGGTSWPTRMDATVTGKPIRFADRTFARGIGVHAYSRIDYPLDGRYAAFRTQYAIAQDERRQYADVTVRIKIDGKTVHEHPHLRADVLAPPVVVDLPESAKMLTLEVDYGQANDTQDRFNWIEPMLLRHKPPATQPAALTTPGVP